MEAQVRGERPIAWLCHALVVLVLASVAGAAEPPSAMALQGEAAPRAWDPRSEAGRKAIAAASREGDLDATYLMGHLAENGIGYPRRLDLAMRAYGHAARNGEPRAAHALARILMTGAGGVDRAPARAVRLLDMAADQGHAPSQYALGVLYDKGRAGLAKDEHRALELIRAAAVQDHRLAGQWMALHEFREREPPSAPARPQVAAGGADQTPAEEQAPVTVLVFNQPG